MIQEMKRKTKDYTTKKKTYFKNVCITCTLYGLLYLKKKGVQNIHTIETVLYGEKKNCKIKN